MRLVDLTLLCLQETIRNDDYVSLTVENLRNGQLLANPSYTSDVFNVLLSINKAVARLATAEKIAYKKITVAGGNRITPVIDLSHYRDIKNIKSVYIMNEGKPKTLTWYFYPDKRMTLTQTTDQDIFVIYSPIVKQFSNRDFDSEEDLLIYGIDDEMCNYISYFAKSELYETRDPVGCKKYLNYFEQYLSELKRNNDFPTQDHVENIYNGF